MTLIIIFCSLCVKLFVVQIINGKELQQRATDQWTRDLTLTAPRGSFFDATGDTLAVSYTTYNVYARAREVKNAEELASQLSKLLQLDFEKTKSKLQNKKVSEVLLKMNIEGDLAQQIYALKADGIYMSENVGRYYVYGDLLTQLLGFSSIDNQGQAGLEAYLNDYLTGIDGYSSVQSDLQGKEISNSIRYYVEGIAGADVTLTANSKIQILLEQVLMQAYIDQKAKAVTGMVLDIKSGEVLAISSKPSFDLNNVPRDDLKALFEYSKMKAVTDTYEPGSTFKILTVAAALEEGLTNFDDRFYCPGYRIVDGQRIKCWRSIGHGSQNLVEAFANSCNCCFMDLALRLGKDRFYDYMQRFGLGKKTGITIKGESAGIVMPKQNVKNVDLARMGFGHAIAVTPIQLASIVCAITNDGIFNTPTVIKSIVDVSGKHLYQNPNKPQRIVSSKTSKQVNFLLEKAENKTADFSFVEGYNIGGKTGTAQKYDENGKIAQGKYISSFIGTYPANNPDLLFVILVDEPSAGAYYGAVVAAPYGKLFFEKYFEFFDIKKDNLSVEIKKTTMPHLEGLSVSNAIAMLTKQNLRCEIDGQGGFVVKQLPPAGTILNEGDTVLLQT